MVQTCKRIHKLILTKPTKNAQFVLMYMSLLFLQQQGLGLLVPRRLHPATKERVSINITPKTQLTFEITALDTI